jgi:hypothetical protein
LRLIWPLFSRIITAHQQASTQDAVRTSTWKSILLQVPNYALCRWTRLVMGEVTCRCTTYLKSIDFHQNYKFNTRSSPSREVTFLIDHCRPWNWFTFSYGACASVGFITLSTVVHWLVTHLRESGNKNWQLQVSFLTIYIIWFYTAVMAYKSVCGQSLPQRNKYVRRDEKGNWECKHVYRYQCSKWIGSLVDHVQTPLIDPYMISRVLSIVLYWVQWVPYQWNCFLIQNEVNSSDVKTHGHCAQSTNYSNYYLSLCG